MAATCSIAIVWLRVLTLFNPHLLLISLQCVDEFVLQCTVIFGKYSAYCSTQHELLSKIITVILYAILLVIYCYYCYIFLLFSVLLRRYVNIILFCTSRGFNDERNSILLKNMLIILVVSVKICSVCLHCICADHFQPTLLCNSCHSDQLLQFCGCPLLSVSL